MKTKLIRQIIAALGESLLLLEKAARASHAEATHESSRAESKYDTRGLEAAYLAGGQARQALEILESIKAFESLNPKSFSGDDPIDVTALVELETDTVRSLYFIGPKGGGLEVEHDGNEITVITPQSPLGRQIMGKAAGQRWTASLNGRTVAYYVLAVS